MRSTRTRGPDSVPHHGDMTVVHAVHFSQTEVRQLLPDVQSEPTFRAFGWKCGDRIDVDGVDGTGARIAQMISRAGPVSLRFLAVTRGIPIRKLTSGLQSWYCGPAPLQRSFSDRICSHSGRLG